MLRIPASGKQTISLFNDNNDDNDDDLLTDPLGGSSLLNYLQN